MKEIKKILKIFDRKQKFRLIVLLIMTIIGAFLELLGITAIGPFVSIAMNADSITSNALLYKLYSITEVTSTNEFLVVLAIALIIIYIIKNAYLVLLYNVQYKFTYNSQQLLEGKLLSCYVKQSYSFHLSNNSAELQRNILQDVTGFFMSVLAYLQLLTEGSVCLVLFLFLLSTDWAITIGVTVLLSLFVLLFYGIFKKKLNRIGITSRMASAKRVQWVQQSLGGIKEIKILEREKFFLNNYNKNAKIYAEKQRKYQLAMIAPRPIMETVCIGSLLFIVAAKLITGISVTDFMPTLSVFAVAAFRMLPSFGRISGSIGTITFQKSAVDEVCKDLEEADMLTFEDDRDEDKILVFNDKILVNHLDFQYPNTEKFVLKNVSMEIQKNKSIAFIGPSGAGKTTLADIILGVLKPNKGEILVDGKSIYDNLGGWHKKIGYIPQNIYLMDDTIRNNIAFGIEQDEIDELRVFDALKEAQLYEYIQGLEEGINTYIGEGGIRLSGGQRQRIGIARALYSNPEVLVLDEATSALDHETEKAIMEAMDLLQGSKTLIIIAHRLTTIQNCDYIYEIKNKTATLKEKRSE